MRHCHEVFEYTPGLGDYGSDWRRIYMAADKATALRCARLTFARDGVPVRIFTAPQSGVGKLIAEFQPQEQLSVRVQQMEETP